MHTIIRTSPRKRGFGIIIKDVSQVDWMIDWTDAWHALIEAGFQIFVINFVRYKNTLSFERTSFYCKNDEEMFSMLETLLPLFGINIRNFIIVNNDENQNAENVKSPSTKHRRSIKTPVYHIVNTSQLVDTMYKLFGQDAS